MKSENKNIDKRITIREIAKIAGVSIATVSRVLNMPERVSPEVLLRVNEVINQYNFIPNQLAKNLYTNDSKSIALFIYDIENPFYTKLIEKINQIAFDNDYTLIICDTKNDEVRELKYATYLQGIRVSGIILTEGASEETIARIAKTTPCVMIDRALDNKFRFPYISSDNLKGAHVAVEYLVRLNHTKIAFAGGYEKINSVSLRKCGYLDVLKKYDIQIVNDYIYNSDLNIAGGMKALEYFISLKEMPTAIFCANDLIAQGLIQRAHSAKFMIPGDFSVVGFDGTVSEAVFPSLTTIKQDLDEIARYAMENMLKLINSEECNHETIIPTKLVIGETCKRM
ncbi:MAG: hypothetical protein A2Y21_08685 [Clostridiales bacterium GWC2_40_7]|nr:MAG: hypothetical protein A2Y21_08685 [Clostridiales bacterium GWC2_40_7]